MKRKSENRVRYAAWMALVAGVLLTGWSMAQPPAPPAPPAPGAGGSGARGGVVSLLDIAQEADTDGNKQVSLEEFKAALNKNAETIFKKMDRNGDGVLTQEDRPVGAGPGALGGPIMEKFREADKDQNGKVTFEELSVVMPNMTQERFKQFDRNGDGVLSAEDRGPGPMRDMFEKADADKNGSVTFDEIKAVKPDVTQEQFKQWDRNGDGVLSPADRPAGPGPGAPAPPPAK